MSGLNEESRYDFPSLAKQGVWFSGYEEVNLLLNPSR